MVFMVSLVSEICYSSIGFAHPSFSSFPMINYRLVLAVSETTAKNGKQQKKKQASKTPPSWKKDSSKAAVGMRRVSPSSTGIELVGLLATQLYLSLLRAHWRSHELLASGEL